MEPLLSIKDQTLLSQHSIIVSADTAKKIGIITIGNRYFKIKFLNRKASDSWNLMEMKENQLKDVASKVAVMLLKKELLQGQSTSPSAPLNFKIEQAGITCLTKNEDKLIKHEDEDENKNTRGDYNSLISYLTKNKEEVIDNDNENEQNVIEGLEQPNLQKDGPLVIQEEEEDEVVLSTKKSCTKDLQLVKYSPPFSPRRFHDMIPRSLPPFQSPPQFPPFFKGMLGKNKNSGLGIFSNLWNNLPSFLSKPSKRALTASEISEKDEKNSEEKKNLEEKKKREQQELKLKRFANTPSWMLPRLAQKPISVQEPSPVQSPRKDNPPISKHKKWKSSSPEISFDNDSFTMYLKVKELKKNLDTSPTSLNKSTGVGQSIFSSFGLSDKQKTSIDMALNPF